MSRMSMKRCPSCGFLNPNAYSDVCWYCDPKTDAPATDDDEPITREWVKQEYGTGEIDVTEDIGIAVSVNGGVVIELFSGRDYAQAPLSHIHTRGDLRRLLAALGWRAEG